MCGRFVQVWDAELVRYVRQWVEDLVEVPGPDSDASYNVAPTQEVSVLVTGEGSPRLESMRWGVPLRGKPIINARVEKVLTSPMWRPMMEHRGVVPMNGFYEWSSTDAGKVPHFIHRPKGLLAVAAMFGVRRIHDTETLCVTLVTCPATADMDGIHDRMPAILEVEQMDSWLDARVPPAKALELIQPRTGILKHYPVAKEVGRASARGRRLIEPTRS